MPIFIDRGAPLKGLGGSSMPSVRAMRRLILRSNLVGRSNHESLGLAQR